MKSMKWTFLALALLVAAGCSKNREESAQDPLPAPEPPALTEPAVAPAPQPEPAPVAEPAPRAPRPTRAAPAPRRAEVKAPEPAPVEAPPAEPEPVWETRVREAPPAPRWSETRYAVIPAGTLLQVRLEDPLDSSINLTGDSFRAILDQDITVNGETAVFRGSVLDGKLSHVERSGRVQGRATMSLQLLNLLAQDRPYALRTAIRTFEAEASTKKDATKVGIGAGLGAVIGAIAGGGRGAAIGAAAGAGAGGATVMATRGEEVKLEAEQVLEFELQQDLRVPLTR